MPSDSEVQGLRGVASAMRHIRLFGIGFAALQFTVYEAPAGLSLPFPRWAAFAALAAWFLATNVVSMAVTRDTRQASDGADGADRPLRQLQQLAIAEVACDATVALALVMSFNFDPTSRLWPLLTLPILEAAMRLTRRATIFTWALVALAYGGDQLRWVSQREDLTGWSGHIPYALGILLAIALISGMLTDRLEQARSEAEGRAAQLRRLSAFARDLSAMRQIDEVIDEVLRAAVTLTGWRAAEFHSDASGRWQRISHLDASGEGRSTLAITAEQLATLAPEPGAVRTVGSEEEGVRAVIVSLARSDGGTDALVLAGPRGGATPSSSDLEVLQLLARQATVALENAALLEREAGTIEELRALHGLKDDFVSILTHELRTPLTSVTGYAELLRNNWQRIEAGDRERYLETIQRNGSQLGRLIDDVLDATRAEQQSLAVELEPVDLGPLVATLAQEEVSHSPLHRLEVDVAADLPPVLADQDRVRQVARNLLSNAVKYSPDGGRVRVELTPAGDEVELRVTDDGVGIPAHQRDLLFKKFSRLPTRTAVKGTGLGLFLCRQLVLQMGGTIGVDSEPERGSTFWVRLPMATGSTAPTPTDADART